VSTPVVERETPKKKRGRETAADMVRSLGLVVLVIIPVWFFAKAPPSDEADIRVVDPSGPISAFATDVPQAPVPTGLPEQWRSTSATYAGGDRTLRVGYVTPEGQYAEYAASTGPREEFVETAAGEGAEPVEPVTVDGVEWEQRVEPDGSRSLISSYGPVTVVVGTTRATAGLEELRVLLGSLAVG